MLTKEQKAHAINWAMRYDIEGYSDRFIRFALFLNKKPHLKADILNFYKGLSPMTQKAYIALVYLADEMKENKMHIFKKMYIKAVHSLIYVFGAVAFAKILIDWICGY